MEVSIRSCKTTELTILKSQLQELAIAFGEILMPAIRSIVSHIQAFIDKLNDMDEGTKQSIVKIALLVAAIGPLLIIIGTTISKVGTAVKAFSSLAQGIMTLSAKVGGMSGLKGNRHQSIFGNGCKRLPMDQNAQAGPAMVTRYEQFKPWHLA